MKRIVALVLASLSSIAVAFPSAPSRADVEGWSYTTYPNGAPGEVYTVVLRDAPKAFVTNGGWRFSTSSGWTQIATTGGGDPSFLATDHALYAAWGAGNGKEYDHARPAIRVLAPGSDTPVTEIMDFDVSACARQHESTWALDPLSGEVRFDGSSHGLPATPADYEQEGCLENTTSPQTTLNAINYPYRVIGSQATATAPRPRCVFATASPTGTPSLFAHGCHTSMFTDAAFEVAFETADGTDRRVHLSDSQRTLFGGARDLKLDDGNGAPHAEFLTGFARPNLAYGRLSNNFIALASKSTDAGIAGEHWYQSIRAFISRDGGATWTDAGDLCGSLGADCYAGGVVYDDATDTFVLAYMQRHAGYGRAHDIVVARIGGGLPQGGSGALALQTETVDTMSWDAVEPGANDFWMPPGAYDGFVALGYFKDGGTRFAYRQF